MNIQSSSSDGKPLRFDPTKPTREAIRQRQPLPSQQDAEPTPSAEAAKVKEARDAHRDKFKQRVANARAHYTANHAAENAEAVAKARAEYNAKISIRKENAAKARAGDQGKGTDSIDISLQSQKLAVELSATAERSEKSAKRDKDGAQRVRELRDSYLEGRLNTDERIARAAEKMLGGDDATS